MTKIAIKFIKKELHGRTDAETIISYIQKSGFSVIFYDLSKDRDTLKQCNVLEYCKTVNNFTVSSKKFHIVFICDRLHSEDKRLALIHEAAHIYLGHLNENVHILNERKNESAAETFAYTVFTYKNSDRNHCLLFGGLIFCAFTILLINKYAPKSYAIDSVHTSLSQASTLSETPAPNPDNNIVYVTLTGNKYHCKACRYIKDKKCIELSIKQAQIKYEPCKVCKPQYK